MSQVRYNFSEALELLKERKVVTRAGWNNPTIKVQLQVPDENSKMTEPYLYMTKAVGEGVYLKQSVFPLDLSCESIMAEDWIEVSMGM